MPRPKGLDWMPLDIDALYESERVAALSPAAEALYIRLLCRCFRFGSLPKTSAFVKVLFPKFAEQWDTLWSEVEPLFEAVGDRLESPRATAERERAMRVINARREAGKAGGRPKKSNSFSNGKQRQSKAKPAPPTWTGTETDSSVPTELAETPSASPPPVENPRRVPKKGEHVQVVETFQRAWAQLRCGPELEDAGFMVTKETDPADIPAAALYAPSVADWTAAAKVWKQARGDMSLIRKRMLNFFESDAPYMRAGGLALFASKFSILVEPVHALNGSHTS